MRCVNLSDRKHGYRFEQKSKMMLPPEKANELKALTKFEDYKLVD